MKHMTLRVQSAIVAAVVSGALIAAPAVLAADVADIGYIDQAALSSLPVFQQANRSLQQYGQGLQRQYVGRAKHASQAEGQRLSSEFQSKIADKQRQVLGPLFRKAQVAIASIASSRNLSVVIDKRIIVFGGTDITNSVRDLLGGVGDPVPPVNTPPPSTVGYVDQQQIDNVPSIKSATADFGKFEADTRKATQPKIQAAKTDADRQQILKDYQKTITDRQEQTLKPLVDKTRNAMSDVAKKRGLALVIDKGNIIYGGTDITSDVTSELK